MKYREYPSHSLAENITDNISGSDIRHVLITAAVVQGKEPPGYWGKGAGVAFWEAWAREEREDFRMTT